MKRYFFFALAGGAGFLVDAGVLMLALAATPLDPFTARLLAIAAALATTWAINRTYTFERSRHRLAAEGARYTGVGLTVALANYTLYASLLIAIPELPPFGALVIASGLAMVLSYTGYARFVFRQ